MIMKRYNEANKVRLLLIKKTLLKSNDSGVNG